MKVIATNVRASRVALVCRKFCKNLEYSLRWNNGESLH